MMIALFPRFAWPVVFAVAWGGCSPFPGEGLRPDPNCDEPEVGDRFRVVIGELTEDFEPCDPSLGFSEGTEFFLEAQELIDGGSCLAGNGPIEIDSEWTYSVELEFTRGLNESRLLFGSMYRVTNGSCTGALELYVNGERTSDPRGTEAELTLFFGHDDPEECAVPSCWVKRKAHVTRISAEEGGS